MDCSSHRKNIAVILVLASYSSSFNSSAYAQEHELVEEVVVTGSRRQARSVFESAAPIDVIGGDEFRNQGASDMTTLIRNAVPSYNVNAQPVSDAATVVRPANLRGLAADHTLVLVNSKRRHRAAVITWLGNGVNDGAQGADISVIPSIALKQVEVLRDGAAAQYGSDAIAGVINFVLKDHTDGGEVEIKYGQHTQEIEQLYSVSANLGAPFTANGFVNVSAEYGASDATDRSVQRNDAAQLIAAGNTQVADPAQTWGDPEIMDDLKTFFNMGLSISDTTQFYAFGNYAAKEVEGGFFFRNPDTREGVYSSGTDDDGNVLRLVADITGDMSGNCPQNLQSSDSAGLAAVIGDPNCFVFNEILAGGFTPSFGAKTEDVSLISGLRGTADSGLAWEISTGFGYNDADFFLKDTVNASLGAKTPTRFDPGAYTQLEKNINIDISYPLPVAALASKLNLAGGFEWRDEQFEITLGEQASWEVGPLASQGFSAASNGFPGFSPLAAGQWSRSNIAFYVDLEADITNNWLLAGALRWEDFDDFGTTTNGKLASRVRVNEQVALRGSYSTGFRAPTPGQSNAFNVSTEINVANNTLENNGTIPSTSAVAALRGGKPLDPEESTNYSFGAVIQFADLNITVDYFDITLEERLGMSQNFTLTDEEKAALIDAGVSGANSLNNFRFFTNGIETNTSGIDVVATYSLDSSWGVSDIHFAYNQTKTSVEDYTPGIIEQTRIMELEQALPDTRWNLSVTHSVGPWRWVARYSYFDDWYDSEDQLSYNGYGLWDVETAYAHTPLGLNIVLGVNNLTDNTPDENPNAVGFGNRYSQWAPGGSNGRFVYLRLIYDF